MATSQLIKIRYNVMVGFITAHVSKAYSYEVLCTNGSYSMKQPVALLMGRILKVKETGMAFSMGSPTKLPGIKVVNNRTLEIGHGVTVEVGTGGSPLGWPAERKIYVTGPATLQHGHIVHAFTEANAPEEDWVDKLGEGVVIPCGQAFNVKDFPVLSSKFSIDKLAKYFVPEEPATA